MNKRIKKKKAKQAELRRQQEFEEISLDPERIRIAAHAIGTAISNEFTNLSISFANAGKSVSKWAEQVQETFARAWLDGYEIEQEKLFLKKEAENDTEV